MNTNAQCTVPICNQQFHSMAMNRRAFLAMSAGAAGVAKAVAGERDWNGDRPVRYPDSDIVVLDQRFAKCKVVNTPIQRLWTGGLWAEGCAWNAAGNYLV